MTEQELSLLDWLQARLAQPNFQRGSRFSLAALAVMSGAYFTWGGGADPGGGYFFFFVGFLLVLWGLSVRGEALPMPEIPGIGEADGMEASSLPHTEAQAGQDIAVLLGKLRWPAAVALALSGQWVLDFQHDAQMGVILYLIAGALAVWAALVKDVSLPAAPAEVEVEPQPITLNWSWVWAAMIFGVLAFIAFSGGRFTSLDLLLWALTLICCVLMVLGPSPAELVVSARERAQRAWASLTHGLQNFKITLSPWSLLVVAAFLLIAFFRLYHLDLVAPEMTSDHAEKLQDVQDILNGIYPIYFERNTGREFMQFYVAAFIAKFLGTGVSYLTLKLSTALAGLLVLPYMYLFAKEVSSDRRVALLTMTLVGVAYWPNVISRIGLRFPFYPLFVVPALYYLLRGLRTREKKNFVWAGIAVGLGLHTYSPVRILPVAMVVLVALFVLHRLSAGRRMWAWRGLAVAFVLMVVLAMPLIRYSLINPTVFYERMLTRFAQTEEPYSDHPVKIFISNEFNSLRMFGWDNGEPWILGVPHRPALDVVTGAFFHLGVLLLGLRYLRERRWVDLFVIIGIPVLLLPSTLALAFPKENPVANRSSGALPLVFVLPALTIVASLDFWRARWAAHSLNARLVGGLVAAGLAVGLLGQNFDLVFVQYPPQYKLAFSNASDLGEFIKGFAHSVGSYANAYVVPYAYWVDTRLVGMYAGDPARDYAISPEVIPTLNTATGPLLILFNPGDQATANLLYQTFPQGSQGEFVAADTAGHNFEYYFVPSTSTGGPRGPGVP
jgi:4-amino-4-deoxy-L-arabinose transferase-like glycosyltransferase